MHSVAEKMRLSELTIKIGMKVGPHCQQQKCRPMTILSLRYKVYADIRGSSLERGRQTTVVLSTISSETLEMRPALLYSDTQSIVGLSGIPKWMQCTQLFSRTVGSQTKRRESRI